MLLKRGNIEAVAVVNGAVVLDDADNFEAALAHQARGHPTDIAEALNDHASVFGFESEFRESFAGDDHTAAPGGFRPTARSAESHRLARDYRSNGVARVHGVGVH